MLRVDHQTEPARWWQQVPGLINGEDFAENRPRTNSVLLTRWHRKRGIINKHRKRGITRWHRKRGISNRHCECGVIRWSSRSPDHCAGTIALQLCILVDANVLLHNACIRRSHRFVDHILVRSLREDVVVVVVVKVVVVVLMVVLLVVVVLAVVAVLVLVLVLAVVHPNHITQPTHKQANFQGPDATLIAEHNVLRNGFRPRNSITFSNSASEMVG